MSMMTAKEVRMIAQTNPNAAHARCAEVLARKDLSPTKRARWLAVVAYLDKLADAPAKPSPAPQAAPKAAPKAKASPKAAKPASAPADDPMAMVAAALIAQAAILDRIAQKLGA